MVFRSILLKTIDEQTCAEYIFDNVSIEDANIIASGDEANKLLLEAINLATLCVSAEAVGCMTSCYLKQFSIPRNVSSLTSQYLTFRYYNIEW